MDPKNILLKSRVIQGFGTLIIREFFLKLFSFIGQIFLARILVPSDFGVYVIIVFTVNFFNLFTDLGLSLAIIQKKEEPTHLELSLVFWLKLALSLGLIFTIWIISPLVNQFYPSFVDSNILMIRVLSVILLLTSFRAIPISLLERKIKYNVISMIDIIGVIIYYFVALTGAFLHFGVWSLIIGSVIKEIIETIIIYIIQPFIPQIVFNINNIKKMIKFGIYIQGNSLLSFLTSSITPVIGGRLSGPFAVGLLDFASNLAYIPGIIATNFARVAFTSYSRIQGDVDLLSKSVLKSVSLLTIIIYLFPVIMLSFGGEIVNIIYTEKWSPAVPSLYWYSLAVIFYPIVTCLGQKILVLGKSKELFFITLVTTIFGWLISYLIVIKIGFTGIAITNFFIYFVMCISYVYILKKNNYSIFSFISTTLPKAFVGICTIIFGLATSFLFPHTIYFLIIKLTLSVIVYITFMYIFVRNDSKELFSLFLNFLKNKKY